MRFVAISQGIDTDERNPASRFLLQILAAVADFEREMIRGALDRSAGNISETARTLGLTRRGLYLKMKRLGLDEYP